MDTQMQEVNRIPRPLGITHKALQGKNEEVYEICSRKFLQGTFPFDMKNLSMERFSLLFKVPIRALQKVVKEGIQEETLLGGSDVRGKLEDVRSKLLDSSLYQYGNSTARLHRLLNYLEDRIYQSRRSEPALIRELNTALANNFKGIDSASKILSLINDSLVQAPDKNLEQESLSRVEILEILHDNSKAQSQPKALNPKSHTTHLNPGTDMEGMLKEIQDTPDLDPIKSSSSISLVPLQDPNGNYDKAKELKENPIPEQLLISPR